MRTIKPKSTTSTGSLRFPAGPAVTEYQSLCCGQVTCEWTPRFKMFMTSTSLSYRCRSYLTLQTSHSTVSSVPLGTPLMGTVVEVRDEHGCVVSEGEGQIFIGRKNTVSSLQINHIEMKKNLMNSYDCLCRWRGPSVSLG